MRKPTVDYRKFRLSRLNDPEFCHLKWLLYWPIYCLAFTIVERVYQPEKWHVIYCFLDDYIPFCEWFLIPYLFWFVYVAGVLAYGAFYDQRSFANTMKFIALTYSVTVLIYFIYPNCQELRPQVEPDNLLKWIVADYYRMDTNTNVCPSLHVIGSFAAMFGLWETERFKTPAWRVTNVLAAVIISISTVFLKQHSAVDILAALPLCAIAYPICFKWFQKPDKPVPQEAAQEQKEPEEAVV